MRNNKKYFKMYSRQYESLHILDSDCSEGFIGFNVMCSFLFFFYPDEIT